LDAGYQPHYFDPEINLLDKIPQTTVANIRDRLGRLLSSEQAFTRMF